MPEQIIARTYRLDPETAKQIKILSAEYGRTAGQMLTLLVALAEAQPEELAAIAAAIPPAGK